MSAAATLPPPSRETAILRAARASIASPADWTQRASGRTRAGFLVHPCSPYAVCRCARGAVRYVVGRGGDAAVAVGLLNEAARALYPEAVGGTVDDEPIVLVNDGLGHDAALAVYDHAIARAEAVS